MQVQTIRSNDYKRYNSPNFGELKVTEGAQKIINSWQKGSISKAIDTWTKELNNTKHWNLEIFESRNKLWMAIESKNNYSKSDCEAPLGVSAKPENNIFHVYGRCIGGGGYVWYRPEFESKEDAENAYNTLKKYQDMQNIDNIDKIAWAVDSVKIMEQAYEHMYGGENSPKVPVSGTNETKNSKLPLGQRLKHAWQTLKG